MRMCLTADVGGYYTGAIEEGRDQFGVKGDFVTSPEISQVFGELIGVWFVAEWLAQGRQKQGVELIEIGPGRGTLMADMLRVGAPPFHLTFLLPSRDGLINKCSPDDPSLQGHVSEHRCHLHGRSESHAPDGSEEPSLWRGCTNDRVQSWLSQHMQIDIFADCVD